MLRCAGASFVPDMIGIAPGVRRSRLTPYQKKAPVSELTRAYVYCHCVSAVTAASRLSDYLAFSAASSDMRMAGSTIRSQFSAM